MKNSIISLLIIATSFFLYSQQGDGGIPEGMKYFIKANQEIPTVKFAQPDIRVLEEEDRINDSLKLGPWRFGYNYAVQLNLLNSGKWITTPQGDKIWLLKISSQEAKTINLTFANTTIPEGNELYVYNPTKSFILGKFTQRHIFEGELGTELVPGNVTIVEYFIPSHNANNIGSVEITTVTHGYRTAEEFQQKAFGSSGNCNMNVNCPDGLPLENQRNSALMLVSGSNGFCSGALINNTKHDGTPYVLTANHCTGSNVTNWIFRFKWQAPGCDNPSSSPSFESLSGAVLRAKRTPSDFSLVEITGGLSNGIVPESCSPYYAGWDRGNEPAQYTYCISHPSGDIKKIAFDDEPPVAMQAMGSSEANSTWKVIWDRNTVTEGGSSGSPLFNEKGQIIGQLWGGLSGCNNAGTQDAYDFYGRVHNSWEPEGSTISSQLKHWLDPLDAGSTSIIGFDPYNEPSDYDASIENITGYNDNQCASSFHPSVTILNRGAETLTSLTINYDYGYTNGTINWTGNLGTYELEIVELPLFYNEDGINTITVTVENPNGNTDENPINNTVETSFTANPNGVGVELNFYMSCWPEENSWEIKDENNNILFSGGNYPTGSNSNFLATENFCLGNGCYKLILKDTYGDGVAGSNYFSCDYDGSMTLVQEDGVVLAEMSEEEADFGYQIAFDFCITTASVTEYDLEAKVKIYPNPSNDNINVDFDFKGQKIVNISSIAGQIIETYQTEGNTLTIERNNMASGVYVLSIQGDDSIITRKVIFR